MTTATESKTLTQVGPGTPMGDIMRQYWMPAAMSSELAIDGDPMRLMLLGEKLIAFRDSTGKVGVMDHRCPHRCASFFFGRNEEGGIRCVYHGWKFDTEGNCLDMANVPAHQDFKQKVRAKAYATRERNGIIWVYMGNQAEVPELPMIESNMVDQELCIHRFILRECNWLQALEGDIDQTHLAFLHLGHLQAKELEEENPTAEAKFTRMVIDDRAPDHFVTDMDYGVMQATKREMEDGQLYWRVSQFMMPFWTQPSNRGIHDHVVARAWVPMDDTHTMFVQIGLKNMIIVPTKTASGKEVAGIAAGDEFLPNTTDWYGRWRFNVDYENDYGMDRDAQRRDSYTGIEGIHQQDQAITESMGEIVDHTFEHLAPADVMLTQVRRRLLRAARNLAKDGTPPPGADDPGVFMDSRGGGMFTDQEADWIQTYKDRIESWTRFADAAE